MARTSYKFGVRIYPISAEVILVKQTVKKPGSGRYVVDTLPDGTHREAHIRFDDSKSIAGAVRAALTGTLGSK